METEFVGIGSIEKLKEIFEYEHAKKILLVTEKNAYEKSGAQEKTQPLLAEYEVETFSEITSNPTIEQIEQGVQVLQQFQPDLVLAVGGGSVVDTAKALNVLATQQGEPSSYVKGEDVIEKSGKPLVVIPTTSGTGAEATHFAVVYIEKTKYSLAHPFILPTYVLVDPQFTFSLPPRVTASTGMDALSQAIEAYWSVNSTEKSKQYSTGAIQLVLDNIERAVKDPDEVSRVGMARAAHLSGKAINIAQTTACHAISYPITSYFDVPHGHAVVLTLPQMTVFNSEVQEEDCIDKRGVKYVQETMQSLIELLGVKNVMEAHDKLQGIVESVGLEITLSSLGIQNEQDRNTILTNGFNPGRMKNNPRQVTEDVLRSMLEKIQ